MRAVPECQSAGVPKCRAVRIGDLVAGDGVVRDCWAVVREVMRRMGVVVPGSPAQSELMPACVEVPIKGPLRVGDVVVMDSGEPYPAAQHHVAVMVGAFPGEMGGRMLHGGRETDRAAVRVSSYAVFLRAGKVIAVWRAKALEGVDVVVDGGGT